MIETHVDRARTAVEREREVLSEERSAYETFRRRVESLSAAEMGHGGGVGGARGGVVSRTAHGDASGGACEQVREAFAETVRPYSVDDVGDEPLLETIREELGDGIALALAPTTETAFTPETKGAILTATRERRRGIDATIDALESEAESLRAVGEAVGEITDWLATADETPLSELGFEALRERHDRLAEFRDRCEGLLDDRQELLLTTTGRNQSADVAHRTLVRYLYSSLPVVYPVLSTVTRLYDLLAECQRAVRAHLTRRA
ncbi:DUF7260 family protein [Halolamina sp. C58]|uniref:DUF7260 family protein n=1 Tax=Halolamina sp. C58 TaxID=3421640 RepID=UPI003EBE92CA